MQNVLKRSGVVLGLICLFGVAPALAAQAPAPPEQTQRAKDPAPVSGELVSLDAKAKTLVIKTTAGSEMKFTYTDATEIIGADKGVSGLATMSGAAVTVHYSVRGTANTATKIEVQQKQ